VATAAAIAEARAHWRTAGAVANPSLGFSYTDDTPRQHLTIQQPFDWLARRGAERRVASAGIERARADSLRVLAELEGDVRRAFYRTIAATESVRLVEANGRLADSLVVISARRLAEGDIASMEHDRVRLEAARVRQLVLQAREAVETAELELRRVLALPASRPIPTLLGDLRAGLTGSWAERGAEMSPRVAMARSDSIGASFQAKSVRRGRLPIPAIEFGADWADPSLPGRTLWLFGLSLPVPLWNQSGGELAAATARSVQATAELAETRLEVARQLADARVRLTRAASRAAVANDSLVPAGRGLARQAVLAYQLGQTGVLPVLEVLRTARELESAAMEDLLAFQEALATWYALVGTGDSR
jgi:cobalt-zinc-cadmium efflux system outer membrane protein